MGTDDNILHRIEMTSLPSVFICDLYNEFDVAHSGLCDEKAQYASMSIQCPEVELVIRVVERVHRRKRLFVDTRSRLKSKVAWLFGS